MDSLWFGNEEMMFIAVAVSAIVLALLALKN